MGIRGDILKQNRYKFKNSPESPLFMQVFRKYKLRSDPIKKDCGRPDLFEADSGTVPKLIVILGPTGSGKTRLSLKLAKEFNGAIISADSRAVYREMDIGTDKPLDKKRKKTFSYSKKKNPFSPILIENIPHYIIDIVRIDEEFNLAKYQKIAFKCITDSLKKGKVPFLVGGTGLYIKSITSNYQIPKAPPDTNLRYALEKTAEKYGKKELYRILIHYDPKAKEFVPPSNLRRIVRALEVIFTTGQPFSKLRQAKKPKFNILKIGLNLPRETLYKNIENRIDKMIAQGLVEETKKLWKKYPNNPILKNTLGYQEIIPYLENKTTLSQAIEKIKKNTKAFARRQITWFKKEPDIYWLNNYSQIKKIIKKWLNKKVV